MEISLPTDKNTYVQNIKKVIWGEAVIVRKLQRTRIQQSFHRNPKVRSGMVSHIYPSYWTGSTRGNYQQIFYCPGIRSGIQNKVTNSDMCQHTKQLKKG